MELLAKQKGECDGLFLRLDDTQHEIQGEEGTEEYSAFWDPTAGGGGGGGGGGGDPISPPPSPPQPPGVINYFSLLAPDGTYLDVPIETQSLVRRLRSVPKYPNPLEYGWQYRKGLFLSFEWLLVTPEVAEYRFSYNNGSSDPIVVIAPWDTLVMPGGFAVRCVDYPGNPWGQPGAPPPPRPPNPPGSPDSPGSPGSPAVGAVVIQSVKGDVSKIIQTIAHPSKPSTASFLCEDCEPNCILLTRKQGDKYASGLCICKDTQEDLESMKDKIKAELLAELPPIVQTRMKAQNLPELKTDIEAEIDSKIESVKDALKTEIQADEPFLTSLKEQIKTSLTTDTAFIAAIADVVKADIEKQEFKDSYFEFLNGDKIAEIITASLNDSTKLNALKDKLGITGTNNTNPQNPTPTDPNKLMANGYEWTIAKNTAGEVVSVSRVAKAGDNLSLLTNSGSAIVTALVAKFPGKSFAVTSSTQNTGTYFYSIDQN